MAERDLIDFKKNFENYMSFLKPSGQVDGRKLDSGIFNCNKLSKQLGSELCAKFEKSSHWLNSNPILIGSWGRGELCPKSDLDVIFLGPEQNVKKFLEEFDSVKLKMRYRVPQDLSNWSVGVESLDVNAIFWAEAMTENAQEKLDEQKNNIIKNKKRFRKTVFRQIVNEQKNRNLRYDSIANYLEPNLKFGPGGLRDILQSRFLYFWYKDELIDTTRANLVFDYYNKFFLSLRQWLHLNSLGDSLVASAQHDLYRLYGFKSVQEFMREVQSGLTRVKFYADWVKARVNLIEKKEVTSNPELKKLSDCFEHLKQNPDIISQHNVRNFLKTKKNISQEEVGDCLKKYFKITAEEEFIAALFESGLMAKIIPGYDAIRGWVQHDQYHRYSVDAHLMQTCIYVRRVFAKPKTFKKLKFLIKDFSISDWNTLLYAALYHDIGKGASIHHSLEGADQVRDNFRSFGFSDEFTENVSWLVKNHLEISQAAFKKNPNSIETKKSLYDKDISGKKLRWLSVFTAVDILSTNAEAWTDWKESLIASLVKELERPESSEFYKLQKKLVQQKAKYLAWFEPALLTFLPAKVILADLENNIIPSKNANTFYFQDKNKNLWIRFFNPVDSVGIFASYVNALTQSGCSIRHAYIKTDSEIGVYDWFLVKNNVSLSALKKRLESQTLVENILVEKIFDEIEFFEDSEEWIIVFKGKDQKGMLLQAAQSLMDLGLNIKWAKVHTWGRNVDDIFGIYPQQKVDKSAILLKLRSRLIKN